MPELGDYLRAAGGAADVFQQELERLQQQAASHVGEHGTLNQVIETEIRDAVQEHDLDGTAHASSTPPIWTPPNPEDDGWTLTHVTKIADAEDESDLNVTVMEGETGIDPYGVRLSKGDNPRIAIRHSPEYRPWKTSWRSELKVQATIGYGDELLVATEYMITEYESRTAHHNCITAQFHGAGSIMQSPTLGERDFDGESVRVAWEDSHGSNHAIDDRVPVPMNVRLYREMSIKLHKTEGYHRYRLWNMETGELLGERSRERVDTALVRAGWTNPDGSPGRPEQIHLRPMVGIYVRPPTVGSDVIGLDLYRFDGYTKQAA